ncbi:gamma-glutamyltransferase family protein [Paraburkholderia oxyphila]|uniref:gamma-glutamyltransferase family protein n=1 Tax=Paraburkholderia oxyphila TaxID=614212 RepID=UPI000480E2DA|nr:gamma-glutamyltransferase family protein [Paraburkholderia oxyphila]
MIETLTSARGMVTAPHHLAAQAGLSVLRDGGNAIEAMIAAASTIAVVYPHMNGIGGDGFWLIAAPGEPPVAIDAAGYAVALATPAFYAERHLESIPSRGPLAVNTVPGVIAGWEEALRISHRAGGRLPLARLLEDARWYARHGAPVTRSQAAFTGRVAHELAGQPGFAQTFLNDGAAPAAGSMRAYPALAATLDQCARAGLQDFYCGDLADAMANELQRLGSPLRAYDLHGYAARRVEPLSLQLETGTVYNLPPPTQGLASMLILGIFERLGCTQAESFSYVHGLVEATKQAFLVRNRRIHDAGERARDWSAFLAPEPLEAHRRAIRPDRAQPWPEPAGKGDTVWLASADNSGLMVSYIQSTFWEFGSGVVLADTGVTCQNRGSSFSLATGALSCIAPGRRPFHTLNPAFARLKDGRAMVYGTMGGDGQPQTQAAVFSRYAMFGTDLQRAVSAPRWLLGRTWGQASTSLKIEARFDSALIDALRRAGHELEVVGEYADLMGHAGAIVHHPDGVLAGATDPRSDGAVAAW